MSQAAPRGLHCPGTQSSQADYDDVEKYRPGTIGAFKDWWTVRSGRAPARTAAHKQYYKVARGDGVIPIVGGWYQNSTFTEQIIEESHGYWTDLVKGQVDSNSINYNQTSHPEFDASYVEPSATVQQFEVPEANELPAERKPSKYDHWYYLLAGAELIEVPEAE